MTNYITTFEPLVRLSGLSLIRSFAEQPVLIGYMRVSKADGSQTLDLQRDALLAAGVEPGHLYEDQASGTRDNRPGLEACLRALWQGDTLVAWKLDRLGCDLRLRARDQWSLGS